MNRGRGEGGGGVPSGVWGGVHDNDAGAGVYATTCGQQDFPIVGVFSWDMCQGLDKRCGYGSWLVITAC